MRRNKVGITDEDLKRAEENGIDYRALYYRLSVGWDKETAINKPLNKNGVGMNVGKVHYTDEELKKAKENGVSLSTIRSRTEKGHTKAEAIMSVGEFENKVLRTPDTICCSYNGVEVNYEQVEVARQNGITKDALRTRIYCGWSIEKAITQPMKKRKKSKKRKDDTTTFLETVGRIKYNNRVRPKDVIPLTKRMQRRLEEMGITFEEVKEVTWE